LADAAHDDPMLGQVTDGAAAVRWNQDIVVEPPPEASVLATDDSGTPYAVRVGERAWGVQFHPEAGLDLIRAWAADTATGPDGRPAPPEVLDAVARAVAEIENAEDRLARTWRSLALAFAGQVRPPRRPRPDHRAGHRTESATEPGRHRTGPSQNQPSQNQVGHSPMWRAAERVLP
jgi:hypothetical protein